MFAQNCILFQNIFVVIWPNKFKWANEYITLPSRCLHFPSLEVEEAAMHNHDSSREVETEAKSKDVGTKEVGEKVGQVETQPDDQAGYF